MAREQDDFLNNAGAHMLASRIAAYWQGLGYNVKVWAEPVGHPRKEPRAVYTVKSNLINGLPGGRPLREVDKPQSCT